MGNPRRTNSHRRNQVRAQVLAEEDTCALCGDPVDKTLTMQPGKHGPRCQDPGCPGCVPHPMRAEVDEIVPVKQGGSPYDRANCQLAHRRCNRKKSAGLAKAPIDVDPFPLSDCWGGMFDSLKGRGGTRPAPATAPP